MVMSEQLTIFLGALLLGAVIGVILDVFRISRLAFTLPGVLILIEDLLFFALAAILTFSYMLSAVNGFIRCFIMLGVGLGFLIYYLTIGALIMKISGAIIGIIKKILQLLYKIFIMPIVWLAKKIYEILLKVWNYIKNILKKHAKVAKYNLKRYNLLLYNLTCSPKTQNGYVKRKPMFGKLGATLKMFKRKKEVNNRED